MILTPLYEKGLHKEAFSPRILQESDLDGIEVSDSVKRTALLGSEFFKKRFDEGKLFPKLECSFEEVNLAEELLVHDYTGKCPAETFEINPVRGCNVGCAYCLVNDGIHEDPVVYENYDRLVEKKLEEQRHDAHYYYFSPKTEAMCEATLQTGIAHRILWAFIEHFERFPDSKARLFMASKAGVKALQYVYDGDSILDLFIRLKDRMQFNTSISLFPDGSLERIEPFSSSLADRLAAVDLCQEHGVMASSALVQPIMIHLLSDALLEEFFEELSQHHIVNFKPEFLTACIENMVLMAQILEGFNRHILKKLLETYFAEGNLDNVKQRGRTAPDRSTSAFWINRMQEIAKRHGISMSICHWVREQLRISTADVPLINENGFLCLGYQTRFM